MNMAASSSAGESAVPCDDFMAFQEVLRKFRRVDDTIIYSLNTGFANRVICRRRDKAIKGCLQQSKDKLDHLQELRAAKGDDPATLKELRKEQSKIRLLRNELNVEEVVKDRSFKAFHDRCRLFYSPPEV
ncbi:hypothetical protein MRX96_011461 [Rhipicephalus microplus]